MFLTSRDGIKCDRCGKILKNKFIYYSDKRTRVIVDNERKQTGPAAVERDVVDFDICEDCHADDVNKLRAVGGQ